jgi:hypothetical protein
MEEAMKKLLLAGISLLILASAIFAFDGYVIVTNNTGYDIWYLYVSHEDSDSWEEDVLGSEILYDGESFRVDLTGYPSPVFDIHAEDEDGDTYTVWGVNVDKRDVEITLADLDTGSFSGYVDVTNDTGYDIWYLYVSHSDSDSWEEDVLGSEILYDGETYRVNLNGYPSSIFDIHAEDEDGDTYTVWGVDVYYEDVTLTLKDLD